MDQSVASSSHSQSQSRGQQAVSQSHNQNRMAFERFTDGQAPLLEEEGDEDVMDVDGEYDDASEGSEDYEDYDDDEDDDGFEEEECDHNHNHNHQHNHQHHDHAHAHGHTHAHDHGHQHGQQQMQQMQQTQPPADPQEAIVQSQAELRKRIMVIQQNALLTPAEKARQIQDLMSSGWTTKQKLQTNRSALASNKLEDRVDNANMLSEEDMAPSWHNREAGILGCKHYQRAAKLQGHCCGRWFTCRFCHDEVSDHNIVRNLTTTMMCMFCNTVQPAGQVCANASCGKKVARYYCGECKLWDDDHKKNIYHCNDCGICRIGKGLGQDYFHCKSATCAWPSVCRGRHKCIERNLESDCPICGEYMFTSTTTVIFMPCGHCIHYKCHQEYIQTSYQCPTCFKSLANMTEYFQRIDAMLAQHEMPPEYSNTHSHVYCNDCEKKSNAKFHFLYHKCGHCSGYNTKVLHTFEIKPDGKPVITNSPALLNAALPSEPPMPYGAGSPSIGLLEFPADAATRSRSLSGSSNTLGGRTRRPSAAGAASMDE
ncbi:zinc-ribbon-domain-containing protein [Entophlyctis helioformis]|nr:zinc-ribbon-domain-containing protein [Entophlyctis helioformis]